ncbi:MAG: DNA-directed RNA polymerase subunit alpha [Candidatus Taylorbacteria bacterium]|nr:DNA-directed RNA polymerase subunit alpha [Candidatus Taylorbacteria bacterium]
MSESVLLPSKPRIIKEEGFVGIYEIDGLYPGYGHTLGNSLRRIILSSLPGAAITKVKINGVSHEFSVISGVKEDVITILLNLKKMRLKLNGDEAQTITIKVKGPKSVIAADITAPSQVEIISPESYICTIADKNTDFEMEMTVEKGLGYVTKEALHKEKVDIGSIALDARFTPILKVNYEVENMRVGERTDFNRLKFYVETDGTVSPSTALQHSIKIMIEQLKAVIGFEEKEEVVAERVATTEVSGVEGEEGEKGEEKKELDTEFLKTRIDAIGLSPRSVKALSNANIRTVGGLARKKEADILDIDGLGNKGIQEIKKVLANYGISLK